MSFLKSLSSFFYIIAICLLLFPILLSLKYLFLEVLEHTALFWSVSDIFLLLSMSSNFLLYEDIIKDVETLSVICF